MRFRAFLFLAFSLGLLVCAAYVGTVEIRPFLQSNADAGKPQEGLTAGVPLVGLSIQSQQLALQRCSDVAMSLAARLQPSNVRNPAMRNCLTLADQITNSSPTNGFAYLVGAMAAAELNNVQGMLTRLALSHKYAPTEQWIAQGRVEVAENARLHFRDAGLAFESSDLRLLVQSQTGIAAIANRYVSQPAFRERITSIVQSLPVSDQKRFLYWVRVAVMEGQK